MKTYKKLVRDKIPEIIEKDNLVPICRTLNDKEYQIELNKKLVEEVKEYIKFFNEERPAYALNYLTPKQYKEQYFKKLNN